MSDCDTVRSPTELSFERRLPGPIGTVWAFLTASSKRGQRLASGPIDLGPGGKVDLRFRHSELSPQPERCRDLDARGHDDSEGEITGLDPPRCLAFT